MIATGVLVRTAAQIRQPLRIAALPAGAVGTHNVPAGLAVLVIPARPRGLVELPSSAQQGQFQTRFCSVHALYLWITQ